MGGEGSLGRAGGRSGSLTYTPFTVVVDTLIDLDILLIALATFTLLTLVF